MYTVEIINKYGVSEKHLAKVKSKKGLLAWFTFIEGDKVIVTQDKELGNVVLHDAWEFKGSTQVLGTLRGKQVSKRYTIIDSRNKEVNFYKVYGADEFLIDSKNVFSDLA